MPTEPEERACFYVNPNGHPAIGLMIINGRLARVDVDQPGVLTSTGIEVDDTENACLENLWTPAES